MIDRSHGQGDDPRVEELARELAAAINRADASGRTATRDHAIDLLKEAVEGSAGDDREGEPEPSPSGSAGLNPFALGIPLLLVGPLLAVLFPPVGLVLVLLGLAACAVGLGLAVGRSVRTRWRARGTDP